MKKSKLKVVLISLASVFVLLIGGVFYYASTKITPEEIKKQALTQLKATFPKADINLGHIDFSLGFSVKLKLEKLEMSLPNKGNLVKVEDLVVKIPLWAVLTGGGTIQIELDKPTLNYTEFKEGNNWTMAMESDGPTKAKVSTPTDSKKEEAKEVGAEATTASAESLAIPGFINNSRLNLKLIDVVVAYQLKDKSSGKVELSRFLIKNLNFKEETAFELASRMKFEMADNQSAGFETLLIGTFNLAEMIEKQTFSTKFIMNLNNFAVSSLEGKVPDIKTNVNVFVNKKGHVKGDIVTSFEERNKISANFSMQDIGMRVDEIKVALFIEDLVKIANFSHPALEFGKASLNLNGDVAIDKKSRINPNLSFSLSPGVNFKQDLINGNAEMNGSFKGKNIKMTQTTKLLSGNIITNILGEFDLNQKEFDLAKMNPFRVDIAFNNLNFTREMIQGILYSGKPTEEASTANTAPTSNGGQEGEDIKQKQVAAAPPLVLPPGTINIFWNQLKIGPEDFNGKAKILVGGSSITTENLNFTYSKGEASLTHSTKFKKGFMDNKFDFKLINLDLLGLKTFLPPMMEAVTGNFSGKLGGGAILFDDPKKGLTHDVNVDVNAVDGEIKGLNLKEKVGAMMKAYKALEKYGGKVSSKVPDINDKFKSLKFRGNLKQDHYRIDNAEFKGLKKLVELTDVKGNLYPLSTTKKGVVSSELAIKGVDSFLQKNTGSPSAPMHLSGIGFSLTPDTGKTLKVLTSRAISFQKKKAVAKVKKKIDAKKKEAKKKVENKVKDAAKNLFKKFKF